MRYTVYAALWHFVYISQNVTVQQEFFVLLSTVKRRDIGLDLSVRPSVRLSHFEGGCLVDITSSSMIHQWKGLEVFTLHIRYKQGL